MKLKLFFLCLSLVWVCQSSFSQEASRAQEIEKIEAGLKVDDRPGRFRKQAGRGESCFQLPVRVLGRKGVLAINAVASMSQLTEIQERMPEIISMVNFLPGSRYADYQQGNDKVAAYGLAALVLGGVAAKAGLFKGLIALILAGKKFIILAAIAAGGFFVKLYRKFRKPKPESLTDTAPSDPLLRRPPGQG